MLSIQQCKRYLKNPQYSEQQIEDIRHGLYQVAHVLIDNYLKKERVIDIDKETEAYRGNILVDRTKPRMKGT